MFVPLDETDAVNARIAEFETQADHVAGVLLDPSRPIPKLVSACRDCAIYETACLGAGCSHTVLEIPRLQRATLEKLSKADEGFAIAPSILVAEPLPSQESKTWLENYRSNIKRILRGRGFDADKIDFLPEPFAAFQYYRYGEHTPLSQQGKRRVMVLDFGGGTFDACVIETTKAGDVSYSGTNQKPIAARSEPVGGYLINRFIAEYLVEKCIPKSSIPYLKKGLDAYTRVRRGDEEPELWPIDTKSLLPTSTG